MSYILGALRKAEHERKGEAGRNTDDWDSKEWNPMESSSATGWGFKIAAMLTVVLLAAISILLWILIGKLSEAPSNSVDAAVVGDDRLESTDLIVPSTRTSTDVSEVEFEPEELAAPALLVENISGTEPRIPVITGHLYFSANESLSRIFADGGSYRAGHVFEDGLKLVSISESQAVFEWRDRRYEIPFGSL